MNPYYEKNKEKIRAKSLACYYEKREEILAYQKQYRKDHPHYYPYSKKKEVMATVNIYNKETEFFDYIRWGIIHIPGFSKTLPPEEFDKWWNELNERVRIKYGPLMGMKK